MPLTRITGTVVQDATLPESKLINPYVNTSGDTMTGTLYLAPNGLVAGTNQLVLSGGNVGIKTLSPQYDLDVAGNIRATGQIITNSLLNVPSVLLADGSSGSPAFKFSSDTNTGIYRTSNGTLSFSSSGNLAASISSSSFYNSSGILSNYRVASVNSTDNSLEYSSAMDTLYLGRDANTINIRTNSTQNRVVINSIGQVSVGTATTISGTLLNVAGRVNATGYTGINLTDLPTVPTTQGGTGLTSYNPGDILYYTSGNTLSTLSSPAQESLLLITSGGVPYWSPRPLAVTHGGTGLTAAPAIGQLLIGNGTSYTLNTLAANAGVSITNGSGTIGIGVTNIPNSSLSNSSVTINTGTGLSGGGLIALGGTLNLTNAGVTSIVAGTGVTISGSTGSVTVNNSGVTIATGNSGVSVSSSTGSVTFSLNPSYAPTFAGLSLNVPLAIPSGGTGTTITPSLNQILYGNGAGGYTPLTLVGAGVTITPDFNAKTLTLTSSGGGGGFGNQILNGSTSLSIPSSGGNIIATTGNVEVLRITNQQYIGIGTTTPAYPIDFGTSLTTGYQNKRVIGLVTQTNNFVGLGLSPNTFAGIVISGVSYLTQPSAEIANIGYYSNDGNYSLNSVFTVYNDGTYGIGAGSTVGVGTTYSPTGAAYKVTDTTTTSTSQAIIDTYSSTLYRSAKYLVQIKNTDNNYHQTTEILVTHDGTNTYMTEYATISSSASLGVIDSNISSGNLRLLITPTYSNNKIRVYRTILGIMN